jgi:hypothetical protein
VQSGWGNPNHGRHTALPDDPLDGRRGSRAPSVGTPAGRGKGTGATPTRGGVTRPKVAVVVEMQGPQPCVGGAGHGDAWVDDFVQKRHNEIDKCSSQHLTEFLFCDLSLLPSKAHRVVIDNML